MKTTGTFKVNFFNPNFTPQITKQSRGKVRVEKVNLGIYR